MSGIRTKPAPSKYIIDHQWANGEKFFNSVFDFEDLLVAAGGTVRDYTDLTELARGYYTSKSNTLSKDVAPFMQWLKGTSTTKDVDSRYVRWRHYGSPKRMFTSLGNPQPDCDKIGAAGNTFKVRFDVDHFVPSDQLAPSDNNRAIIIIESYPRPVGASVFEYEARLLDSTTYLPKSYLSSGRYWVRAGQSSSYRNPLGGRAGTFSFNTGFSYIEFEVPLSTMTKFYEVDEETHLREGTLMVGCKYDDGTIEGGITNRMAIEFDASFEKEMELLLLHGTMTKNHIDPSNKNSITTGPGLYTYLDEANIINYNPFVNSIDMILDLISSYWYDRVPVGQRNLMLMTGEAGLKLWHEWLLDKFGSLPLNVRENFVLGDSQAFDMGNKKGYSLGNFQFTTYQMQPYGKVSVGHLPVLDDKLYDSRMMDGSIYTVRSHEFIAMDWGMGNPNIVLLKNSKKDRDITITGTWSEYGPVGKDNPYYKQPGDLSLGDKYQKRRTRTFGLAVMDLSRVLLIRPSV